MVKKTKRKKKQKKAKAVAKPAEETTEDANETTVQKQNRMNRQKELHAALYSHRNQTTAAPKVSHPFWDSQPVPKMDQEIETTGPIETKTVDEVKPEPYALAEHFEWYAMDLQDDGDLDDLYNLLSSHYVEDDENMFRFNYSRPFLRWALMPPGYLRTWHLAVRVARTKRLVGCITAIPAKIRVHDNVVEMVEINFLCVHKKLREKRLAPVLIKEITRRVNLQNVWQAAYTAGVVIPKPIARNQYWHRSFDPKKLVEIGFSSIPRNSTLGRMVRLSAVDQKHTYPFRPMTEVDVPKVCNLLNNYLTNFKYTPVLEEEEIKHWFTPKENVVQCYVLENDEGEITDMFSYYCLSSHVIGNDKHKDLHAVYSYYNVAQTLSWTDLMKHALTTARHTDAKDVFNCLNVMENAQFLQDLRFGPGDGYLHYYLYNWLCPALEPGEVGLVLM